MTASESTGTGRKQDLYDAHMAKQRHEPSWELPKVLRIYYSCISLLLPLLYAASLFPLLQRRFLKKKDTPTPLHPGLLEEERLAANHSAVYVFNKRDVCIHRRSFLRLATRIHLQPRVILPWIDWTSCRVP